MSRLTPDEIARRAAAEALRREREQTQARLQQARADRGAADGRGSGPLPYGYRHGPWDGIEIDPAAAETVRLVLTWYWQGKGPCWIADELNHQHRYTSRGTTWRPSSIEQIIQHERLYTYGERVWNGVVAVARWPIIAPPFVAPAPVSPLALANVPLNNAAQAPSWAVRLPTWPPSEMRETGDAPRPLEPVTYPDLPPPVHQVPVGQEDRMPDQPEAPSRSVRKETQER